MTMRHEFIHIRQVRNDGWFTFYIAYLLYYLVGLVRFKSHSQAYFRNPYEVEAYKSQDLLTFTREEIKEIDR